MVRQILDGSMLAQVSLRRDTGGGALLRLTRPYDLVEARL